MAAASLHTPVHPVRIVTAASLFDGHDAAINIMRRILQSQGCEVIHLGHNRSVDEIVTAVGAGGRAGRRRVVLPGRPRRVLPVPGRSAPRRGRRPRAGVRRGRRRDRHQRDRGARGLRRHEDLLARRRAADGPRADDQHDRGGLRRRSGRPNRWPRSRTVLAGRPPLPGPGHHRPRGRSHGLGRCSTASARRPGAPPLRCSGSPAPAAPASRRSPTSSSAASGSTRRTSSGSRCWRSTRPGAAAGARCSATASA